MTRVPILRFCRLCKRAEDRARLLLARPNAGAATLRRDPMLRYYTRRAGRVWHHLPNAVRAAIQRPGVQ